MQEKKSYVEPTLEKRDALVEVTQGAPLPISQIPV